ncbi:endonuclease/exonuclease/phosphatase family protein [Vibrio paucivorans]|uniref:Endonuclease/exonuclease/phosphatase family protein n=1 Tax=Vibrio paucivorans TaxID=2829489 RepID=A0A9X3CDY2_9VIBR|nr:endonuclease/exonuclease/phosphatase family protein [Vibrio paucivorans]MCW8333981.1 endonuclease/exonuclease/phosphatase family protein [Vibrio paucivorans]
MLSKLDSITISTFNLFNYLAPPNAFYDFANIYTVQEWQQKKDWISNAITRLNSDVIAFQEVFSVDELQQQMFELGYPYFVTVDTPHAEEYIYSHPVLAIASRFPIIECSAVGSYYPTPDTVFEYNRKPIHAVIKLPLIGLCDIYVVHFKSQRPADTDDAPKPLTELWHQENIGRWKSTMQRGLEAHLLHQSIVDNKKRHDRPCIMLGDFNKPITAEEFAGLMSQQIFRQEDSHLLLSPFHLYDAWELYSADGAISRPYTHYMGAKGSVLDYILLSAEFAPAAFNPKAKVSDYFVLDSHLVNPIFEQDKQCSDHAVVSVQLTALGNT